MMMMMMKHEQKMMMKKMMKNNMMMTHDETDSGADNDGRMVGWMMVMMPQYKTSPLSTFLLKDWQIAHRMIAVYKVCVVHSTIAICKFGCGKILNPNKYQFLVVQYKLSHFQPNVGEFPHVHCTSCILQWRPYTNQQKTLLNRNYSPTFMSFHVISRGCPQS